jgi:hypothetical protein
MNEEIFLLILLVLYAFHPYIKGFVSEAVKDFKVWKLKRDFKREHKKISKLAAGLPDFKYCPPPPNIGFVFIDKLGPSLAEVTENFKQFSKSLQAFGRLQRFPKVRSIYYPKGYVPETFADWRNHIYNECRKVALDNNGEDIISFRRLPVKVKFNR